MKEAKFLVVGGAGSIGSAVVRELFKRNPRTLHVIDVSENNLAEMVRHIRSSVGYNDTDFHAYCFDVLGSEFESFAEHSIRNFGGYDYVLNFFCVEACTHEKDPSR